MKKTTTVLSLLPIAALAVMPVATLAVGKDINYLVGIVNRSFTTGIYLIISFSVLTFVYNIYNYFIKPDAERKDAGMYVLMSVIGFFVILSFWGLVNIVKNSLNLDTGAPPGLFGGVDSQSGGSTGGIGPYSGFSTNPAGGSGTVGGNTSGFSTNPAGGTAAGPSGVSTNPAGGVLDEAHADDGAPVTNP